MSFDILRCCGIKVEVHQIWELQNYNGFIERKLFLGICPKCTDGVAFLYQKREFDGAEFGNILNGIEVVKTTYREKRRVIAKRLNVSTKEAQEWIYGTNVQIKNKKGEVIKIRQYSTDFKTGAKKLEKEILTV